MAKVEGRLCFVKPRPVGSPARRLGWHWAAFQQTRDGQAPTKESNLANGQGHPSNGDCAPDGQTRYALPRCTNHAYGSDRTQPGDTLAGKRLGTLVQGAKATDCRALGVGPKGTRGPAIPEAQAPVGPWLHRVGYRPGDRAWRH
jgi:hypothetical protein